jgi:cell division protein FtsQ
MHQLIDKKNRIIIYLIFFIILSTTNNKTTEKHKTYSNKINKINVTGLSNENNLQLVKKLDNFLHTNIFTLKSEDLKNIMSKNNIIEEYNIKKIYPSVLNIYVKPTKFIAKIHGNDLLLVGSNGKLIKNKTTDETLPYIFGKFNSKEFLNLRKNIESSKFNFIELKKIFYYSSNRWDILTNDDILIKLPENDLLWSLNFANKLITNKQFKDNKLIDLRITNHLITQ